MPCSVHTEPFLMQFTWKVPSHLANPWHLSACSESRVLLDWKTQQALEFENRNIQFTKEEIFEDDQMLYFIAPHSSALQASTMKFRQDFIDPDGSFLPVTY